MWSQLVWDDRTQLRADMVWRLPLSGRPQSYCQEVLEKCNHNCHCNGCNCNGIAKGVHPFSLGREKLFCKVVTQSDIKQCRLAIPKKQVKKHFPLHVATKGDLFSMVDNEGKVWKFRFSFWKSTRTWVFTGGWNLFVKEKGLNMGDMVSFLRSTGPNKQLYIDWEPKTKSNIVTKPEPFVSFRQTGHVVKLFGVNISTNMNK